MKILMIAPQPFFEPRGTPISVYQRLASLSRQGHEVDLVTYHIGRDVSFPGVRLFRIPRMPFIKSLKVGPSWQKIPLDFLLFWKAFALLLRNRYDVIHSHEEAGFFSVVLSRLFHTRHLYDMHSSLPKQLVNFSFGANRIMIAIFEYLERLVINTCDAMITIGPDLQAYVKGINPHVPNMMIENLPLEQSLVDSSEIRDLRKKLGLEGKLAIVYTGTFERYQGLDLLLESAAILKKKYPQAVYVLVGGKPNQVTAYRMMAERLDLADHVHFTGTLTVEEANQFIAMADILVSPRIEGTSVPLKIYTYLKAGKAIIATNLPAHTLVLDHETSMLVDPQKEAFAAGLARLIEDESLRQRLAAQSQRLAEEKYSQASYLAKLEEIYRVLDPDIGSRQSVIETVKE